MAPNDHFLTSGTDRAGNVWVVRSEDAATAEISRAQLWQWVKHKAKLEDGRVVTRELYERLRREELEALGGPGKGSQGRVATLLDALVLDQEFREFLTLPAYDLLDQVQG